jgi:hypothetical protein
VDAPGITVCDPGAAAMVKSGAAGASTTSDTTAVWLSDPLVPVTVSVEVPTGVLAAVVTFRVALPDPFTDAGLNVAVVPAGAPETLRAIVPVNPSSAAVVTV